MSARSEKNTGDGAVKKIPYRKKGKKRRSPGEWAYDSVIPVRMYAKEREEIRVAAEAAGESVSGFVRDAALRAAKRRSA